MNKLLRDYCIDKDHQFVKLKNLDKKLLPNCRDKVKRRKIIPDRKVEFRGDLVKWIQTDEQDLIVRVTESDIQE